MDVRVHGKNMQVDDATRELADEKVGHASRILDDVKAELSQVTLA